MNYDHFYKIDSNEKVAAILANKIRDRLKNGQRVLWLVSGGSAVEAAAQAAGQLAGDNLSNLMVGQADERYGLNGHPDSNWQMLIDAGFRLPGARLFPILNGLDVNSSTKTYAKLFGEFLRTADYKLALLGMGADCHTAGVLPGSPAVDANQNVISYQGLDYKRITLSLNGLQKLDEALVYATGESKRQALETLASSEDFPLERCPAGVIRRIPQWSVYNDLVGEAI